MESQSIGISSRAVSTDATDVAGTVETISFRQPVSARICCVKVSMRAFSAVELAAARDEAGLTVARRLGPSGAE